MSEITTESNRANKSLEEKDDYLGTIPKAKAIQGFLEGGNLDFEENQMFALFGDWGSGKTTLFHYLQKHLDKKKFKPVFFEAWKYETDENLPLSLMEMLTDELGINAKAIADEVLEHTFNILVGFAKSVSVKTPFGGFSPKVVIEEAEKSVEAFEKKSVASNIKVFEKSFQKLENSLLDEKQTLIVFIDDLDRCEPENVIKLLSAIKLFFTYGKRTIFFFGVDKKAVEQAIEIKYKDVVKSAEYLEKIFDFSFEAPKGFDLYKLMQRHFPTQHNSEMDIAKEVTSLFNHMKFTNPRKVKKVLNKYALLKSYKYNEYLDESLKELIPSIITNKKDGNLLETVISLYLIVLHEFDYELFVEVEDFEGRKKLYIQSGNENNMNLMGELKDNFDFYNKKSNSFNKIREPLRQNTGYASRAIFSFMLFFLPRCNASMSMSSMQGMLSVENFLLAFDSNKMTKGFAYFLQTRLVAENEDILIQLSDIPNFFKMVRTVL